MNSLRIIVLGYIVRGPLGGFASYHLQYLLGLARLGHDVYYVEDSDDYPSCYDPARDVTDTNPSYGLRFAGHIFKRAGLGKRWAYYDAHTYTWHGPCADRILDICHSADLLLNIGEINPLRPWLLDIKTRILVDLDPVFTQIKHLTNSASLERACEHTAFFTIGENLGRKGVTIPDDGLPWQVTRQPVVLETWPVIPPPEHGRFTTVMLWDSYATVNYDGHHYGMKSESFAPYEDLPKKLGPVFELAVGGVTAPRDELRNGGWLIRDSREPTRDLWTYRRYIQDSKAEFSVAKHGYVVSCSGWFSDRSVAYLASARPVLLQETGFSHWMETGEGIVAFASPEEAVSGAERIQSRYDYHCAAAREIAREYFDHRKVLPKLIEAATARP